MAKGQYTVPLDSNKWDFFKIVRFHVDNHAQVVESIRNNFKDENSIKNEIEEPKNHKIER